MSLSFDPSGGLIVVPTQLWGPTGDTIVRLALDTGATASVVSSQALILLGYRLESATQTARITTGSGVIGAPRLNVTRIEALGQSRQAFPVVAHILPPSATVDGVLGLDFFRGTILVIDLRAGVVTVQ